MSRSGPRCAPKRSLLVAALLLAAWGPPTATAASPGPAPVRGDCLTLPAPCVNNVGYVEFRLAKHVLHVGETVSGTYAWNLSETRSARIARDGPGLKRLRCSRPARAIAQGTSGSSTCVWKATSRTGGWATSLGMTLFQNGGAGAYAENDFYVVLGKEQLIEGTVRRQNTDKVSAGDVAGVPNVPVKIHGPSSKTARTNANGYYYAIVKKSGTYRVTPALPKKVTGDRAGVLTPRSRVVKVTSKKGAKADFVVDDDLEVTAKASRSGVQADGTQVVDIALTAVRFGEPVPGLVVAGMPNSDTVGANPNAMPVPARYCSSAGGAAFAAVWPTSVRGAGGFEKPFDITLDDKGRATVRVQLGTVPGSLNIEFWARTPAGSLRYDNIAGARKRVTIANGAVAAPGDGFGAGLSRVLQTAGTPELSDDAFASSLALTTNPVFAFGLAYTYVTRSPGGPAAILLTPATTPPTYGTLREITAAPGGTVIPTGYLSLENLATYANFHTAAKSNGLPPAIPFDTYRRGESTSGWRGFGFAAGDPDAKVFAEEYATWWAGGGYPPSGITGGC